MSMLRYRCRWRGRIPRLMTCAPRSIVDDMTTARGVVGNLYLTKNRDWESEREFRVIDIVLWDLPDEELDDPLDVPYAARLRPSS